MPNHESKIVIGCIIKTERFKEVDLRITTLTPQGTVTLFAKGATKPTAKLKGALQLFNLIEFTVVGQNITGAHIIANNLHITRDINRYNLACYICQTIIRTRDHSPETFALLISSLELLAKTEVSCFKIYIWFYAGLLVELGFDVEEFAHSATIEKFKLVEPDELDTVALTLTTARSCINAIIQSFAQHLDIVIPSL